MTTSKKLKTERIPGEIDTPLPPPVAEPESPLSRRGARRCPVTRVSFQRDAVPVSVEIDGKHKIYAPVKEFSTGSLGWYVSGKIVLSVGGTPVEVQVGMTMTVVKSKELPLDDDE